MAVKADEISRIIEQKIAGFEREIDLQRPAPFFGW
jgi:hypothetical protein